LKRTISLHNTHATQRNKAAYHNYTVNVAYQFHFAGTKYMIRLTNYQWLWWVQHILSKLLWFLC